jgi:hypothetical protein
MDCAYWEDVVRKLSDPSRCNWASHVLSSGLPKPSDSEVPNLLAQALECVPANEIIEGTIYAYRDWSAQPYCDLILAQFNAEEILSLFLNVESPDSNMKVGVLGILEDTDSRLAVKLASVLNKPDESEDVLSAVQYSLRAT